MRADAQENRARIVEIARVALAEDGAASLNLIAQRAGVGPGTLYRHFPNREALVLEVYEREVAELVDAVPGLLAAATPLEALRRWTVELVSAMRRKHGLGDALSTAAHHAVADRTHQPVVDAITAILQAGQTDGTIRAEADAEAFLQLTGAMWRSAAGPRDRSAHMLDLVLDGLATPTTHRAARSDRATRTRRERP